MKIFSFILANTQTTFTTQYSYSSGNTLQQRLVISANLATGMATFTIIGQSNRWTGFGLDSQNSADLMAGADSYIAHNSGLGKSISKKLDFNDHKIYFLKIWNFCSQFQKKFFFSFMKSGSGWTVSHRILVGRGNPGSEFSRYSLSVCDKKTFFRSIFGIWVSECQL